MFEIDEIIVLDYIAIKLLEYSEDINSLQHEKIFTIFPQPKMKTPIQEL
jgi:hypothetical protein